MGENSLDNKLKAMEARLINRADSSSRKYSGYWSFIWSTVGFTIFSFNYGRKIVDKSLAYIEQILQYFG